ncbi:MAG TPA: AsnC family transcriptional regulator [Alphaproteobacteria bacterium]|nr:AsnC family transcriptional regulator [Alphaproteobacteria bacterium]
MNILGYNSVILDKTDRHILRLIQEDATLSIAEVAEAVGLSSSPCWRRIRQMEEAGIIRKRVTLLDREKLGLHFVAFATVKLATPNRDTMTAFEAELMHWPEVMDCYSITGEADYMLRVVTADIHHYDAFQRDKLLACGLISDVLTRIVVRPIKRINALPVDAVAAHAD